MSVAGDVRVTFELEVSIDTQGLPYSRQANLVPATPYDNSQPPCP
jgi:hypothetical protein